MTKEEKSVRENSGNALLLPKFLINPLTSKENLELCLPCSSSLFSFWHPCTSVGDHGGTRIAHDRGKCQQI